LGQKKVTAAINHYKVRRQMIFPKAADYRVQTAARNKELEDLKKQLGRKS
jgi:hypothetical protein